MDETTVLEPARAHKPTLGGNHPKKCFVQMAMLLTSTVFKKRSTSARDRLTSGPFKKKQCNACSAFS
jgi:hypothetical protein